MPRQVQPLRRVGRCSPPPVASLRRRSAQNSPVRRETAWSAQFPPAAPVLAGAPRPVPQPPPVPPKLIPTTALAALHVFFVTPPAAGPVNTRPSQPAPTPL